MGNAPVDVEVVHELDGLADVGEGDDGDVGIMDGDEALERGDQGFAGQLDPDLLALAALGALGPFGAAGGLEAGAGGGLDGIGDLLGGEEVHDAAFSLASRRARTLTTPSMMASGRGGQPGTYMSTGTTWSTGPTRV